MCMHSKKKRKKQTNKDTPAVIYSGSTQRKKKQQWNKFRYQNWSQEIRIPLVSKNHILRLVKLLALLIFSLRLYLSKSRKALYKT